MSDGPACNKNGSQPVADHQDTPSSPRSREFDPDWLSLARIRQYNEDTKQLIAGAKREISTSYAILAEIDRILARR